MKAETEGSPPQVSESIQNVSPQAAGDTRPNKRKKPSRKAPSFDWNTIKTLNIRPTPNAAPITPPPANSKVPIWLKPPAGAALGSIATLPPGTQIPFIVTTTAQGLPALVPLPLKPTSSVSQTNSIPVTSTITTPPPAFPISSSKSDSIPIAPIPLPPKLTSPERDRQHQVMGLPMGLFEESDKRHLEHDELKRLRAERSKLEEELRQLNEKQNRLNQINAMLANYPFE